MYQLADLPKQLRAVVEAVLEQERGRELLPLRGRGDLLLDGRLVPTPNSIARIASTSLISLRMNTHQALAIKRHLTDLALGPERAPVAVPCGSIAGEPRRDGAHPPVEQVPLGRELYRVGVRQLVVARTLRVV